MILGTAGHVDHGKTALVRALTGVDTDRLAEEKRRGITIDLGFAPLVLEQGTLGVVDVPGHEAFVRNMLAGATGVELALLVVAADEGVMPQTREHLSILTLLGVRDGVVALTKRDLVDDDWTALVIDDVRQTIAGTPLANAEIVETSVVSNHGIDALRRALGRAAERVPSRVTDDLFRLPIDRAFSVKGTGTVVTGTVWSGSIQRDASVMVLPGGREARVRGIESHGQRLDFAHAGMRAAIALGGVDVGDAPRGTVLVTDKGWAPSRTLLADVTLLSAGAGRLGPRTRVHFHLGTAEAMARVVAQGGALEAGQRRSVRLVLDQPILARAGDRFVLRSGSPLSTIGGGVVGDPAPPSARPRPWGQLVADGGERLDLLLRDAGTQGLAIAELPVRLGVSPPQARLLVASKSADVRRLGDRVISTAILDALAARLAQLVSRFHEDHPLELGASLQSMRAALGSPHDVADEALRVAQAAGSLEVEGALIRRAGWRPAPSERQRVLAEVIAQALASAGREPPALSELIARHGAEVPVLARMLERDGRLVQVEADRYYDRGALEQLGAQLASALIPGRAYPPGELRDVLGVSRKYLIPLLEYWDSRGVTERHTEGRTLASPGGAAARSV